MCVTRHALVQNPESRNPGIQESRIQESRNPDPPASKIQESRNPESRNPGIQTPPSRIQNPESRIQNPDRLQNGGSGFWAEIQTRRFAADPDSGFWILDSGFSRLAINYAQSSICCSSSCRPLRACPWRLAALFKLRRDAPWVQILASTQDSMHFRCQIFACTVGEHRFCNARRRWVTSTPKLQLLLLRAQRARVHCARSARHLARSQPKL